MGNNSLSSPPPPPPSSSTPTHNPHWPFAPLIAAAGENPSPGTAVPALQSLCDSLMFSSDEQLNFFPIEMAAKFLTEALRRDGVGEENVLAARGIVYLCDSMPDGADAVVECGGIPALCARLRAADYMELAEECVKALEKISCEDPMSCLQHGAVMAVLNIIEFFPINTQRTALNMVENTCECVIQADAPLVIDAVKVLCTMLMQHDPMVANTAASSMAAFATSFTGSSYFFDELCKCGVIKSTLDVIALNGLLTLDQESKNDLVELLTIGAFCSIEVIKTLFELNVSSILTKFLLQIPCNVEENYGQVHAFLALASAVIPPLAKDDQDIQLMLDKENIIRDEPKFLLQFATDILPVLVQLMLTMKSGANMRIIYGCASIANNVIYFLTPEMILDLVKDIDISRFLAQLLTFKNRHILVSTLNIIQNLIVKLPEYFLNSFVKEGVVDVVDALALECSESAHRSNKQSEEPFSAEITKCFCYAFDSLWKHHSSEPKSCRVGESVFTTLVKHIKSTNFPEELISKVGYNKALQKIKASCADLRNGVDLLLTTGSGALSEADLSHLLERVMQKLNKVDSMSVSSFIRSGILSTLVHYLSNGKFLQGNCSYNDLDDFSLLHNRFYTFCYLSLLKVDQNGKSLFLTTLTRNLQDALSSFHLFPIIRSLSYKPISQSIDIPARHSTMSPFLSVRFVSEAQTEMNDNENVLTVGISSSFEDIEHVLWIKDFCKRKHIYASLEGIGVQTAKSIVTRDSGTVKEQLMSEDSFSTFIIQNKSRTVFTTRIIQENQQKIIFFMNGEELDRSLTLYQSILKFSGYVMGPELWKQVYTVTYTKAKELASSNCSQLSSTADKSSVSERKPTMNWPKILHSSRNFVDELPFKLEEADLVRDIFFMLKILQSMGHLSCQILHSVSKKAFARGYIERLDELKAIASSVTPQEFVNAKLTDKLERQMQDFLVSNTGAMPSWCTKLMTSFPFLLSFEAKCKYFRLSAFQSSSVESNQMPQDPLHIKFKANRNNILGSAEKMMSNYSSSKALIELEYDGEIGTGLGPTVEFYTLVSHEFQKLGLAMWREDCNTSSTQAYAEASRKSVSSRLVSTSAGLFPRPFSKATKSYESKKFSEVISKFILLGQIIARAIKDQRILDLPFTHALYKLILDQELDICDIQSFDPHLGRTLMDFEALIGRKHFLDANAGHLRGPSSLSFRNSWIEDLCLDFSLPGYPEYVLPSERMHEMLNMDNLEEYVAQVVDATVRSGIAEQVKALKSGINKVFPLKALQIFNEVELERLICGEATQWNFNDLHRHISFDHGYTSNSFEAISLVEIMQELEHDQRKAFLQFVTGSTRLPQGGLASLTPKLTVVRKQCTNEVDMELPSVMTCANYLKLPPYSSKEIMRRKILYAISEGQGAFHLS